MFLTQDDEPLVAVASVAVMRAAPEYEAVIAVEQARLRRAVEDRKRAAVAAATSALLTVGGAVIDAYDARKRARGRLDFDDLILGARALLARSGGAAWVLYKLDGGLDHVLIDEAQDTNPEQWEVVRALTDEFFAGEGARERPRTVFAVGDPKQSIYGFQRADPAKFSEMKGWFAARARGAGQAWNEAPLETSFRSTAPVLAAVDAVFAGADAARGVVFEGRAVRHEARRAGQAGRVELWEAVEVEAPEGPPPWKPPIGRVAARDAADELARRVADHIAVLCNGRHILESRGRPARPGDILVLVRRRSRFVHELTRQLKQAGVAAAGVDRMVLAEHIAIMDLMALGRFLLLPGDDLSLAETLKSPAVRLRRRGAVRACAWPGRRVAVDAPGRGGGLGPALRRRPGTSGGAARPRRPDDPVGTLRRPSGGGRRAPAFPRPPRRGGRRPSRRIPRSGAGL